MESRVVANVDKRLEQGAFYDAYQLCRAVFERYTRKKDARGGLEFAAKYAVVFADHGQYEFAVNLGEQALKFVQDVNVPPTLELAERFASFFLLSTPAVTQSKYDYMHKLIQWSKSCEDVSEPEKLSGLRTLHSYIADAYFAEGKLGLCQNHLVFCDDADALSELVQRWQNMGYPSEKHYFSLRLVLILLSQKRLQLCEAFIRKMDVDWNGDNIPAPLQAAFLVWAAAAESCHPLLEFLLRKYALVFRVDASFPRLVSVIEREIFGIQHHPSGLMGMLQQMFGSSSTSSITAT